MSKFLADFLLDGLKNTWIKYKRFLRFLCFPIIICMLKYWWLYAALSVEVLNYVRVFRTIVFSIGKWISFPINATGMQTTICFQFYCIKRVMHPKIVSDEMLLQNHDSECLPSSNSNYRHLWNWHHPYPCRQMLTLGEFSETFKYNAEYLSSCLFYFS